MSLRFSKIFIFFTFYYGAIGQKIELSISVGPSIPIGNFASKNASKAEVIVVNSNKNELIGFYRKKSAFAVSGWHVSSELKLTLKNKFGFSISSGHQKLGSDLTNFETHFKEFYNGVPNLVSITQPDFIFDFVNFSIFYSLDYKRFRTQIGPQIGTSFTKFPNYERLYTFNGHLFNVTHRENEKGLSSTMYGLQISQIYLINKNLTIGLNIDLSSSSFKYHISPKAIGLDPLGSYDDTLQTKILSIGIRTGYWF